jgi:uncharacterized cupin superfamily protein
MSATFLFLQCPRIGVECSGANGEACAHDLANLLGIVPVLRFDLAWRVMCPETIDNEGADIPSGNPRTQMNLLHQWLRQTLQSQATSATNIIALIPALKPAAEEWIRINVSFYASTVVMHPVDNHSRGSMLAEEWARFKEHKPTRWQDWWLPPLVRPWADKPMAALQNAQKRTEGADFTYLTGLLGSDRLAIQTYHIQPYKQGNRFHSHSDVDECYFILKGQGTLRVGSRSIPIGEGDFIPKPGGSGSAMEFTAGREGLTVVDIESWRRFDQTDVVRYPDHRETYLRGPGLNVACADKALFEGSEITASYDKHYVRRADGTKSHVKRGSKDFLDHG